MKVDGLNAGYASTILEQYLENPDSVPSEWRALFEADASDTLGSLPGLARLLERARVATPAAQDGNGAAAVTAPTQPSAAPAADELLLGGVAAAMALVKAYRMHGHLAAHLDPLGSEPVGDPALEPERLIPRLTPELQARIPASLLRLYVPAEPSPTPCRGCGTPTAARSRTRSSTSPTTSAASGSGRRSSRGSTASRWSPMRSADCSSA